VRTIRSHLLDQRVEHEARPEAALRVYGTIVAAELLVLVRLDLVLGPDLLNPSVVAGLLVCDAVAVLAAEDELLVVALDVCCAAGRRQRMRGKWSLLLTDDCDLPYRDVELLYKLVARRPLADVDAVQLLLLDVEEAYCVCLLFPERPFAERAVQLNVWLALVSDWVLVAFAPLFVVDRQLGRNDLSGAHWSYPSLHHRIRHVNGRLVRTFVTSYTLTSGIVSDCVYS
jgi:hypothetical protein